jgi:hypothetical protein
VRIFSPTSLQRALASSVLTFPTPALNYLPSSPGALRRVKTPTNQATVQGRTTCRSKERLTKPKRRRSTLRQGIGFTTVRPSLPPHLLSFLSSLLRWTGFSRDNVDCFGGIGWGVKQKTTPTPSQAKLTCTGFMSKRPLQSPSRPSRSLNSGGTARFISSLGRAIIRLDMWPRSSLRSRS